jgi:hypothetical protein
MQKFRALVSEAVDVDSLRQSWESEPEYATSPKIQFDVEGKTILITILSGTPWAEANFKQMFSIVVHRVAPGCGIEWID